MNSWHTAKIYVAVSATEHLCFVRSIMDWNLLVLCNFSLQKYMLLYLLLQKYPLWRRVFSADKVDLLSSKLSSEYKDVWLAYAFLLIMNWAGELPLYW
jgi:hypothetical protein